MRFRTIVAFLVVLSIMPLAGLAQPAQSAPPPPPPPAVPPTGMPQPPPFVFNLSELKFGAQGVGVQSCMYVQVTNASTTAQSIKKLYVADGKDFSIQSPSQQMLPVTVPPTSSVTISVCFKPLTSGDHHSYLALVTQNDSFAVQIQARGLKSEDLAKMPKAGLTIEQPKQKKKNAKEWLFRVRLLAQARVTLQVFDALGMLVQTYSMNDLKPEGVYEQTFEGLDKGHLPLPPGTYYVRCVVDEIARNSPQTFTQSITIK